MQAPPLSEHQAYLASYDELPPHIECSYKVTPLSEAAKEEKRIAVENYTALYKEKMELDGFPLDLDEYGMYKVPLEWFPQPMLINVCGKMLTDACGQMLADVAMKFLDERSITSEEFLSKSNGMYDGPISFKMLFKCERFIMASSIHNDIIHLKALLKQINDLGLKDAWLDKYGACLAEALDGKREHELIVPVVTFFYNAMKRTMV